MILYRDNHWLVVNKPAGLATHGPRFGELGVVEWLELHLNLKTHPVSRLDRGTSGVLLLALDPAASGRAQAIHEQGTALKTYEFLSEVDSRRSGLADQWSRDDELDGRAADTHFERLGPMADRPSTRRPGPNLYRARIARGRRHQIRRHAAASGVPILGDSDYGGARWPRLCLHCREVVWPELTRPLTAPLPPSFEALRDTTGTADPAALALAFALCRDRRGEWLPAVSNAWRVVHRGEIPELPVAVDIYGQWFNAQWFDESLDDKQVVRKLEPLLELIRLEWGCRGGVVRTHRRNPHRRQLVAGISVLGEAPPERFNVMEHGLQYEISLTSTQHTGLFLDQRDSRRRLARLAAGARLANLFAYTCSFSCAAVAAGAEVAFSVDVARPCLNTGKTNFALNGLAEGGCGKFIQEDARKWLRRQRRRQDERPLEFQTLDLLVCDPPVFASSKDGGQFSVDAEWAFLAESASRLLAPGAAALFANNHRTGDRTVYRQTLQEHFGEVVDLPPPLDYPDLPGQPPHVHTFWCRKADQPDGSVES